MEKIRVVYNLEMIVAVLPNDNSTTYYPESERCMVAPSDEIKSYLQSKGIDTTPIDEYHASNH